MERCGLEFKIVKEPSGQKDIEVRATIEVIDAELFAILTEGVVLRKQHKVDSMNCMIRIRSREIGLGDHLDNVTVRVRLPNSQVEIESITWIGPGNDKHTESCTCWSEDDGLMEFCCVPDHLEIQRGL